MNAGYKDSPDEQTIKQQNEILSAKDAEIAALKADNDKLCAENHDFREEFALENIALTKQLATARECLREAMSKCAAMHYRRGMNPQDDPDYAKWKAAIGGEGCRDE